MWYKNLVHRDYYSHFTDKETVSRRLNNLRPDGEPWTKPHLPLVPYFMALLLGEWEIRHLDL